MAYVKINLRELRRSLAEAEKKIDRAVEEAVDEASEDAQKTAQSIAPIRSGFMKSNIDRKVEGNSAEVFVDEIRGDAYYAKFVEFGTEKMRAQPFMLPAAEKARADFPATVARKVREAIE